MLMSRAIVGMRWFAILLMPILVAPLAGCAKKTYPVQGQVVFEDGAPAKELAGYGIAFQAKDVTANANGTIKDDGSFAVGTFEDGDGAPLGKHRVMITPPPPPIDAPRPRPVIADKYGNPETSGLTAEITAQTNKLTLKVERLK
jgi:hypothetical protein